MSNQMIDALDEECREFYVHTLRVLTAAEIPFLLGGAYAFERYTGIARHTKDLDVFVRPEDAERSLQVLGDAGYETEMTYPHWLGKAHAGEYFVDIIFHSGNGVAEVDDLWFMHAPEDTVLDVPVKLVPAEEMLWTKMLIMERERFDGADVAHILRARAADLDWQRLLLRMGRHWRILLAHLTIFGYIYPSERDRIPEWIMRKLLTRLERDLTSPTPTMRVCQGTILSREQYLIDVEEWNYLDGRVEPLGSMTQEDVEHWTDAINDEE